MSIEIIEMKTSTIFALIAKFNLRIVIEEIKPRSVRERRFKANAKYVWSKDCSGDCIISSFGDGYGSTPDEAIEDLGQMVSGLFLVNREGGDRNFDIGVHRMVPRAVSELTEPLTGGLTVGKPKGAPDLRTRKDIEEDNS